MSWRLKGSVALLALMIVDVAMIPLCPWYAVDSPEVPTRHGQLVLFYVDHLKVSYIINGTSIPGYETYWQGPYETQDAIPVFMGTMTLNVLVAISSGIAIAVLLLKDRPKLKKWTLASLAVLGWVATLYFVVSFSVLLAGWDSYFPGFYGSVHADWTDAWTYYAPGVGWYLMLANSILATLILVSHAQSKSALPWRARKKRDVASEAAQPKANELETPPS